MDPQLIFESPEQHIDYMTGPNPEGQYFDRKEARNVDKKALEEVKEKIIKTISAFTNSRGGLLVLGIDDQGQVPGLGHLSEPEYNSLAQVAHQKLSHHQARSREWMYQGHKLLLFYVPEGTSGICETTGTTPKAWKREGANSLPLTSQDRERLIFERNKRFEQLTVCEYDFSLVNKPIYDLFRKLYLVERDANYQDSDQDFLLNIGACKREGGVVKFTNAGYLFFASNPRNYLPSAYVRMLKYEQEVGNQNNPGTAIFDKDYDGSLPEMLRKIRSFINDSPYFRRYSYRNPQSSGIIEEPEYPLNAVEEAIVNAIIHRDYQSNQPIVCTAYRDAFVVKSPGRIMQDSHIPIRFDLGEFPLTPYRRNTTLVEWARLMRDESGQRFVRSLAEGTRTMLDSMRTMQLPEPSYTTNGYTQVILRNNYQEREARYKAFSQPAPSEYTNLFALTPHAKNNQPIEESLYDLRSQIFGLLKNKLQNTGWIIDRDSFSRITVHRKGNHIPLDRDVNKWLQIFPAYTFQLYVIEGQLYLSIDYDIQIKNIARLSELYTKGITDLRHKWAQIRLADSWTVGKIEDFTAYYARVYLPEFEKEENVELENIIPSLPLFQMKSILKSEGISFDLSRKLKELTFASQANAARDRAQKIREIVDYVSRFIFPVSYNGYSVSIQDTPVHLQPWNGITRDSQNKAFGLYTLSEPQIKVNDNHVEVKISDGLIRFGAFQPSDARKVEVIPFVISGFENGMQNLLQALSQGSTTFRGLERTFRTRISYTEAISRKNAEDFLPEIQRLLAQDAGWVGDTSLSRIFLIHIPEDRYSPTDIQSPYYSLKEFLLAQGIPVQMVDTPTLLDAKYKDLNLALNIIAKTGGIPWVLPDALPDVDLFIGLSYTQYKDKDSLYRTMGYANVFNAYGQWQFFKGNSTAFPYDQKHQYFFNLIQDTLHGLTNTLSETPSIHVHYSAKFSREDRTEIVKAVHSIRPKARVTFVWINTGHNLRFFDDRLEGNGSLSRGSYVTMSPNQFYLSSTGYNTLRKTLGTPIMLEVNTRVEPFVEDHLPTPGMIALHILALSKLNWASSQSVNGEPVTIKYARDIARLSQVFLRRKGSFYLHPALEKTPWFI